MSKRTFYLVPMIIILTILSACDVLPLDNSNDDDLSASGRITAQEVKVSAEVGGIVQEIDVMEGQSVEARELLFRIDDSLLQAQRNQAVAVVEVAEASLDTAKAGLVGAHTQHQLAVQGMRQQERVSRTNAWRIPALEEFRLPNWYFHKSEQITAAEAEVQGAMDALDTKVENLEKVLQNAGIEDLVNAENQLNKARVTYVIAKGTLDQAKEAEDNDEMEDAARKEFNTAIVDLEAAQHEYLRILSSSDAEEVMDARAHVAVAQARLDNAQDIFDSLLSGEDSLQVVATQAQVAQAEAAVAQAQANLDQAEAALQVIDTQLEKYTVYAPAAGVVLTLNIEVGEIVTPGSTALVTGNLDPVKLTVYIPEDRYGGVYLGQEVEVSVDSFPEEKFIGKVTRISDKAEFTPRNVQTVEGRRSTVYGVDIVVPNPDQKLKPGMPADVTFLNN